MKPILLFFLTILSFPLFAQNEHYLLIGTYTTGKSEGIHVYKFNSNTADFNHVSTIKTSNPSFLAVSPDQKFVYAVNENNDSTRFTTGGSIAAFSFDPATGSLKELNKQWSGGVHPCYVAIDKTGKWVVAGNYSSGSLAILPVKADGTLDSAKYVVQHKGSSINIERQKGPHVHSTVFSNDNNFLFVPDLGIDKVMEYRFDSKTGNIEPGNPSFFKSLGGSGPRHFEFHPNGRVAYLMEEMSGTVAVFKYGSDSLTRIQLISSHPVDYKGKISSADIHVSPDGKFLYCSNRGESNTIAIFSIEPSTGTLSLVGHQSTMGQTPRNFNFDPSGNFLLVANQQSDNIVIFKRDKKTGLLEYSGKQIEAGNPVCIKWIKVK